jgi:hypothetical protein
VDGDSGLEGKWELEGLIRSRICPRKLVSADSWQWIGIHQHYRSGFLLTGGGVIDQPAVYLEAMALIEQWANRENG